MSDRINDEKKIDRIDRKILTQLQVDCRLSYTELASRVGLSISPCIERVHKLEAAGYILGYSVLLNPKKLGAGTVFFIEVGLQLKTKDSFDQFKEAVGRLDEVQECYLVTGKYDFLLKVRVKDIDNYKDFLENKLLTVPGVQNSLSAVVMDVVKDGFFKLTTQAEQ